MKVNVKLSKDVAKQVTARREECWRNAIKGLAVLPQASYVEGWIITSSGLIVEHAWLEVDGELVDPTRYQEKGTRYFVGVEYNRDSLSAFLVDGDGADARRLKPGLTFPLASNTTDERYAEYRAAFNRAWEAVTENLSTD